MWKPTQKFYEVCYNWRHFYTCKVNKIHNEQGEEACENHSVLLFSFSVEKYGQTSPEETFHETLPTLHFLSESELCFSHFSLRTLCGAIAYLRIRSVL